MPASPPPDCGRHPPFIHRLATEADLPAIAAVIDRAISTLQADFLTPTQITASRRVMGLDTRLITDRTYMLVLAGARIAGFGGWSPRATLYGGDHSTALRDDRMLNPATEPARIRAMYTDPDFARMGVGRRVLALCEAAARAAGFTQAEMMATLAGEPLYAACGYRVVERMVGLPVPLVRMARRLD